MATGRFAHYLQKILTNRVYNACRETPLKFAAHLTAVTGNQIYLKREDLQHTYAFNVRGAYNKIAHLTEEQQRRGIVTCCAGNHAQGVAFAASRLGVDAVVVMPHGTWPLKVSEVDRMEPVKVKLHGYDFVEAQEEACRIMQEEGRTMIHPFDDPLVIAGQGTIGMEIVSQCAGTPLDAVFCVVGGGGLISGIAAYIKQVRPEVKIIGVEMNDACPLHQSLEARQRVTLPASEVGRFSDEVCLSEVGLENWNICRELVDDVVIVNTDEVCAAIKDGFFDCRVLLEPQGAMSIAAAKKYSGSSWQQEQTFVCVASAANMDFDRLRFVSERADASETFVAVTIPEQPGRFKQLYDSVHPRNVTEFSYRVEAEGSAVSPLAHIYLSFQAKSQEDALSAIEDIRGQGFECHDLSANEMAKVHGRHLVGGRSPWHPKPVPDEVLYRFEFPWAPGALHTFLTDLSGSSSKFSPTGSAWNVSLFHYRHHGDDIVRVLVGMQVGESCKNQLPSFLADLGYKYYEEQDNPVYIQFLE